MRNDRDYVVIDLDAPLDHGCDVVVKIEMGDGPRYFEGTLTTKRPRKAKTLDVALANGFREHRIAREHVTRIVGIFEATRNW